MLLERTIAFSGGDDAQRGDGMLAVTVSTK